MTSSPKLPIPNPTGRPPLNPALIAKLIAACLLIAAAVITTDALSPRNRHPTQPPSTSTSTTPHPNPQ